MQERYRYAALGPLDWRPFLLDYKGDVDTVLTTNIASARSSATGWKGVSPPSTSDLNSAFVREDADLTQLSLATLEAEIDRLEKLINIDRDTTNKYSAISKKIADETVALTRLCERLADCEGAKARAESMVTERTQAYARVFDAIVAEEAVRRSLYAPLMARLDGPRVR
jgi:hypothetical protein